MDPFDHRPRVKAGLEHRETSDGRVIVTAGGIYHLEISSCEFRLLNELDGRMTCEELISAGGSVTEDLLDEFVTAGLLVGTAAVEPTGFRVSLQGIEFGGFGTAVTKFHMAVGRFFFSKVGAILAGCLAATGAILTALFASELPVNELTGPTVVFALAVSTLLASVIHETAHAMSLAGAGRRIGVAGFGLYWGALTFYVDATDGLLMSRRDRVKQALVGPFTDGALSGILMIAGALLGTNTPYGHLLWQMSVLLWVDVLVNLCPFLELDGYWALSDLLDRPNLRRDSKAAIVALWRREHRPDSLGLAAYGVVSILFGLALVASSCWIWFSTYAGLVESTWAGGLFGKTAVTFWLAPTLLGGLASFVGLVRSRTRVWWTWAPICEGR